MSFFIDMRYFHSSDAYLICSSSLWTNENVMELDFFFRPKIQSEIIEAIEQAS